MSTAESRAWEDCEVKVSSGALRISYCSESLLLLPEGKSMPLRARATGDCEGGQGNLEYSCLSSLWQLVPVSAA